MSSSKFEENEIMEESEQAETTEAPAIGEEITDLDMVLEASEIDDVEFSLEPTEPTLEEFGEPSEEDLPVEAQVEGNPEEDQAESAGAAAEDLAGSELEAFESADIEETEFLDTEQVQSIIESVLFATDRPQSLSVIKQAFKGTNVKTKEIKEAIKELSISYADPARGFCIEEVNGGYQLRTKVDNMDYLKRMMKARPFKLSGPALEVLSIVAYKQPTIKHEVDEIRGVESGHLLRALMEKHLVAFAGKSDLPGKPMFYQTTRKFLEIFGLRNLRELPSLAEIDDLIPEGIGDVEEKKTLGDMTEELSEEVKAASYSEGEEELGKITDQLSEINTSSDFFEQEKARLKAKKEAEKAQDIRDAIEVGEEIEDKDRRWLDKYDERIALETAEAEQAQCSEESVLDVQGSGIEIDELEAALDSEDLENGEVLVDQGQLSQALGNSAEGSMLTAEEMMEFSADPAELRDAAGEPEADLEQAIEKFDAEVQQANAGDIGNVNVEELKADLAVFDDEDTQ